VHSAPFQPERQGAHLAVQCRPHRETPGKTLAPPIATSRRLPLPPLPPARADVAAGPASKASRGCFAAGDLWRQLGTTLSFGCVWRLGRRPWPCGDDEFSWALLLRGMAVCGGGATPCAATASFGRPRMGGGCGCRSRLPPRFAIGAIARRCVGRRCGALCRPWAGECVWFMLRLASSSAGRGRPAGGGMGACSSASK
jgi:hypothetical protein